MKIEDLKKVLLEELKGVYDNHSEPNWGNYGEAKANASSLKYAEKFISLLTLEMLEFDLSIHVDPDGSMSFDWENTEFGSYISASFGSEGLIFYAGLRQNGERPKGRESFKDLEFPGGLHSLIIGILNGR